MPILLHGAEVWSLNATEWVKMQAFHLHSQHVILQIKWNDFVTNEEVAKITGLSDVRGTLHQRRIHLFGHVATPAFHPPYQLHLCSIDEVQRTIHTAYIQYYIAYVLCSTSTGPDWQRSRGRPRTTWDHHNLL